MANMYETTKKYAKEKFDAELNNLFYRFNKKAKFILPREWVVNELNARKRNEEEQKKVQQWPLIGKMIYKYMYTGYCKSSKETQFILNLMDELGIENLTTDVLAQIMKNREDIYEEYFRCDYEYEFSANLAAYMFNSLGK